MQPKINIPNPCNQLWDNMSSTSGGRYCDACEKVVIDFTSMTTDEIFNYISSKQNEKICGRYKASQTEGQNLLVANKQEDVSIKMLKKILFTAIICFGINLFTLNSVQAKTVDSIKEVVMTVANDSILIKGVVLDESNLKPISWATVSIDNITVEVDVTGAFEIKTIRNKRNSITIIYKCKTYSEGLKKKIKLYTNENEYSETLLYNFDKDKEYDFSKNNRNDYVMGLYVLPSFDEVSKEVSEHSIPNDFVAFDNNKDKFIQPTEIVSAIDNFFDNAQYSKKNIDDLIDYFFEQ